ncbi:MAG: DUF7482 domain-containing protein [Actinomycetota bacterium]
MERNAWKIVAGTAVLAGLLAGCGDGAELEAGSGDKAKVAGTTAEPVADPATAFPVVTGWADGEQVDYLLQEVSDPEAAELLSEKTGFDVPVVESLADVPKDALANLYLFMNGIEGPNPFGFQMNVIDSVPGDPGYSPLWLHTFVEWERGVEPRELTSEEEILDAEEAGEVTLEASDLVINCPVLPDGETGFPIVTGFVDGQLVDYTLQEISDPEVTDLMREKTGGFPLDTVESLSGVPQVANLYLFMNGIEGPNPFGYQMNVIDSVPGDPGYSPLWLHTFVEWSPDAEPMELTSEQEILDAQEAGEVTLETSDLVINCPVIPGTVRSL